MSGSSSDGGIPVPRWVTAGAVTAHLLLPVGWVLAVRIGRPRFFGLYLYGAIALLLFDILAVIVNRSGPREPGVLQWTLTDSRIVLVLQALTVSAFASLGRGPLAYALAATGGTVLAYRGVTRGQSRIGITLLLTCLLGAILLGAKVFTVPYLAQSPDTFVHVDLITTIVEQNGLTALRQTRYNGFLVFHVLAAIATLIGDVSSRQTAGLLFTIAFPATAVGVFLVARQLTRRKATATIAAILMVTNVAFLVWGTKVHYQSLSSVLLVFLMYIVFRNLRTQRSIFLLLPIVTAWVYTHHLSVAMGIFLLTVPLFLEWWFDHRSPVEAATLPLLVFTVVVTKWSILTRWFGTPISWILIHSPMARLGATEANIGTTRYYINVYDGFGNLLNPTLPFLVDYMYLSPLLAITAIGVLVLLGRRTKTAWLLLATATLPILFYFPNPTWLPLWGVAVLTRWDIITLPFLICVSAIGIMALLRRTAPPAGIYRSVTLSGAVALFMVATLFLTIATGFYAPTTANFLGEDRYDKRYLDNEDLAAAAWLKDHAKRKRQIFATSKLSKYLGLIPGPAGESPFKVEYARISSARGTFVFPEGLTVIQVHSFRENSVKVAFNPKSSYYPKSTVVTEPVSSENVYYDRYAANVIYDNGPTIIHEFSD